MVFTQLKVVTSLDGAGGENFGSEKYAAKLPITTPDSNWTTTMQVNGTQMQVNRSIVNKNLSILLIDCQETPISKAGKTVVSNPH